MRSLGLNLNLDYSNFSASKFLQIILLCLVLTRPVCDGEVF